AKTSTPGSTGGDTAVIGTTGKGLSLQCRRCSSSQCLSACISLWEGSVSAASALGPGRSSDTPTEDTLRTPIYGIKLRNMYQPNSELCRVATPEGFPESL